MENLQIIRPESFGATVYNPCTVSYFFINRQQFNQLNESYDLGAEPLEPSSQDDTRWDREQFDKLLSADVVCSYRQPSYKLPSQTLAAPIRVYFELTTLCNLKCTYCLNDSGAPRTEALDTAEIRQTIRNLGRDGVFEVRLTGGEVTLMEEFSDIGNLVKSAGMSLTINSNLTGNRKVMNNLINLSPSLLITSLDANESGHQECRGHGYQRVIENIRYLRKAGLPVRINCSLNRHSLSTISEFVDTFVQYGCDFCFILLRPVGRASADFNPPSIKDLMSAMKVIEAKQTQYPDTYFSTSFHVVMEEELIVGGINMTGCNAIQKSFNINSDGSVLPCAFLYELSKETFNLGNIRNHDYSIIPIWQKSAHLQKLRKDSADINKRCISCGHFKNNCLGSCVFMDLYAHHSNKPDPYCKISVDVDAPYIQQNSVEI